MGYDLLLKGARVIDLAQDLDGVRDVGIVGDKIAVVAEELEEEGRETVQAMDMLQHLSQTIALYPLPIESTSPPNAGGEVKINCPPRFCCRGGSTIFIPPIVGGK